MAKKRTVSQSRTMWVKKGDVVGGKVVKKGYVAQYGKPEKRVSATVKLSGGGTRTYKEGRAVKKPAAVGGGVTPAQIRQRLNKPSNTADNKGPKSDGKKPSEKMLQYRTGEGVTSPSVNKWPAVDARYAGMRRVSVPGTFTQSYERSRGGKETVQALAAVTDQRRREQRRIAAAKRRKGK